MIMRNNKYFIALIAVLVTYAGASAEVKEEKPWYKSMSWKQAACYTGATALAAYGLFKGYNYSVGKENSSPFQDLSALCQIPGNVLSKIAAGIVRRRASQLETSAAKLETSAAKCEDSAKQFGDDIKNMSYEQYTRGLHSYWENKANQASCNAAGYLEEAKRLRNAAGKLVLSDVLKEFVQTEPVLIAGFCGLALGCWQLVMGNNKNVEQEKLVDQNIQTSEQSKQSRSWVDKLKSGSLAVAPFICAFSLIKLMEYDFSSYTRSIDYQCR
jgi:hypothetical protein